MINFLNHREQYVCDQPILRNIPLLTAS